MKHTLKKLSPIILIAGALGLAPLTLSQEGSSPATPSESDILKTRKNVLEIVKRRDSRITFDRPEEREGTLERQPLDSWLLEYEAEDSPVFHKPESFFVMITGEDSQHYLELQMAMWVRSEEHKARLEELRPQIEELLQHLFREKSLKLALSPKFKWLLKEELLMIFNEYFPGISVKEIYFTKYTIH